MGFVIIGIVVLAIAGLAYVDHRDRRDGHRSRRAEEMNAGRRERQANLRATTERGIPTQGWTGAPADRQHEPGSEDR